MNHEVHTNRDRVNERAVTYGVAGEPDRPVAPQPLLIAEKQQQDCLEQGCDGCECEYA